MYDVDNSKTHTVCTCKSKYYWYKYNACVCLHAYATRQRYTMYMYSTRTLYTAPPPKAKDAYILYKCPHAIFFFKVKKILILWYNDTCVHVHVHCRSLNLISYQS